LTVHPSSESKLRGDKNNNIKKINKNFSKINFRINTSTLIDKESVSINFSNNFSTVSRH
jgi:hypothetical protein